MVAPAGGTTVSALPLASYTTGSINGVAATAGAAVVYAPGAANQAGLTTAVSVLAASTLTLTDTNDTYAGLTVQSGTAVASTVNAGLGTITLTGNLHGGLTGTGATAPTLAGMFNLGRSPREISTADGAAASDLTLAGAISGVASASLVKQGPGTLVLAAGAVESYQGPTTLNQGTTVVNGTTDLASAFTVNGGARLAGTGMVGGPVTVTTATLTVPVTGGQLTPGTAAGLPGALITGPLVLSPSSIYAVDLTGTLPGSGFDQVIVNGTIDLGGATLALAIGGAFTVPAGTTYTILDNNGTADPVVGTFAGLPNGATFTVGTTPFRIFYTGGDGNDVVVVENSGPGVVYVDDSTNFNLGHTPAIGEFIPDADLGTPGNQPATFGTTAFSTISAGVAAVGSNGLVVVNAGTYPEAVNVNKAITVRLTLSANVTINSLDAIAAATIDLGANALTVGDATGPHLIAATVAGAGGSLTKVGTGTLTLAGANTYSGTTTVSQGVLSVTNAAGSGTGAGNVVVGGGTLSGTGTITGSVTVNSGGTLAPGAPAGTLTVGGVTLNTGSTFQVTLNGTGAGQFSQLATAGSISLVGGPTFAGVLGFTPAPLSTFVILHNLATGTLTGTFAGASGAIAPVTIGGQAFTINYAFAADPDLVPNDGLLARDTVPVLTSPGTQSVPEVTPTLIPLGTLTDPDTGDQWTVVVNWGDGSPDTTFTTTTTGPLTATHAYPDGPSSFTATVTVTDLLGASATTTFTVNVQNVPPTVSLTGNATVLEGSPYSLTLSGYTDPGTDTPTAVGVAWGDGATTTLTAAEVATLAGGGSVGVTHTYADGPNPYTIAAAVTDEDGTFPTAGTRAVTVTNVAPTVTLSGAASVAEGSPFTLTLSGYTDPGTDTPVLVVVDWGDGTPTTSLTPAQVATLAGGGSVALTHTYADGVTGYTVTASVTDEDGTFPAAGTRAVTVTNVAPTLTAVGSGSVAEGSPFSLTLAGYNDPGTDAAVSVTVNWGDGSSRALTPGEVTTLRTGGQVALAHTYPDGPASFPVTVDVSDEDGAFSNAASPLSVSVTNVAPTVALTGGAVAEGSPFTLTVGGFGGYADPGSDAPTAVVINWGDGSTTPLTAAQIAAVRAGGTATLTHTFADGPAPVSITAAVTDEDGTVAKAGAGKTVQIVGGSGPPSITGLSVNGSTSATITEGQTVTATGTFNDPDLGGATDVFTATVTWGDGTSSAATVVGGTFSASHVYADDSPTGTSDTFFVSAVVSDGGDTSTVGGRPVSVVNAAPTVLAGGNVVLGGDRRLTRSGSFTDPGPDTFTATVDYGDGSGVQPLALSGTGFTLDHTYAGPGSYPITVRVTDDDGGDGVAAFTATANAPTVATQLTLTGPATVTTGAPATFVVTALDANGLPATGYIGTVHFTSTDRSASLPGDATLTHGTGTFVVTFRTPGGQTLGVADTANPALVASPLGVTAAPPSGPGTGPIYAVGSGAGSSPVVAVFNADGTPRTTLLPFNPAFHGGVRVATGDVTGDGTPDVIAATGPGGAPLVQVFDGRTGALVQSLLPFESTFAGGVYVTTADLNGDGFSDIVATPDEGGGPRVVVFSGKDGGVIANFFGINDPAFRGGARAAVGDLNGDGTLDMVVVAGFGGGPRVAGYDGHSLASGQPVPLFGDFFIFEETLRNGVFVTAGDVDGDGFDDVIFGGGPDGGPRVFVASGRGLVQNGSGQPVQLGNFFGGDPANRGGIRVAAKDLDGDGRSDLIVGAGTGAGSRVTVYLGSQLTPTGAPPEELSLDTFPGFSGGVYVG